MKLTDTLSTGQKQAIVARIKHGGSLKLAARELGLSHNTVHDYSTAAFRKMGCKTMLDAALIAMREGLIS